MGIRRKLFSTLFTLTVGAVTGLLLAKKPGTDLKKELRMKADSVRKDVAKKVAEMGEISKAAYDEVVAEIVSYYEKAGTLTKEEAEVLMSDLKERWNEIGEVLKASEDKKGSRHASSKRSKQHHR